MAVAYDAFTRSNSFTTADPFTFSHTPTGTPKGILVACIAASASDLFDSTVSYGGVAMTAVTGGRAQDAAGEAMSTKLYFLGASIPTGTQTVSIDHTAAATAKIAYCVSVTASTDTEISGTPVLLEGDGTVAEQNVDTSGTTALRFAFMDSGRITAPTAGANSTSIDSLDLWTGSTCVGAVYETTAGSGSRAIGFSTASSDDRAIVHLAVAEVASANVTVTPTTASLTTATFAPTVTATTSPVITPTTATLNLSAFAPTVTVSGGTARSFAVVIA